MSGILPSNLPRISASEIAVDDVFIIWDTSAEQLKGVLGSEMASTIQRVVGGTPLAPALDVTPDSFSFVSQTGVPVNTNITSNTIIVTNINSLTAISIVGGSYAVNGGAFVSTAGMVNLGDSVVARVRSPSALGQTSTATLIIGGVSASFSVSTPAEDSLPDTFSFSPRSGVAVDMDIDSNQVVVTGINISTPISIVGGAYSVNGGSFVTAAGMVASGDTVIVRVRSPALQGRTAIATLTVGEVAADFSVSTVGDILVLSIDYQDNPVIDLTGRHVVTGNTGGDRLQVGLTCYGKYLRFNNGYSGCHSITNNLSDFNFDRIRLVSFDFSADTDSFIGSKGELFYIGYGAIKSDIAGNAICDQYIRFYTDVLLPDEDANRLFVEFSNYSSTANTGVKQTVSIYLPSNMKTWTSIGLKKDTASGRWMLGAARGGSISYGGFFSDGFNHGLPNMEPCSMMRVGGGGAANHIYYLDNISVTSVS